MEENYRGRIKRTHIIWKFAESFWLIWFDSVILISFIGNKLSTTEY